MDFNELASRPLADLRTLAAQYGIPTHHRAKAETVARLIMEKVSQPPKVERTLEQAPQPVKSIPVMHTEDDVRKAIAAFTGKDGFIAQFLPDGTWFFAYRGAEESGHMSVPLRVIRMKAESIAKGSRKPVTVKNILGQDVMLAGA